MAFSPDSRIVAFVIDHHLIRLHEVETFRHLATLEAPRPAVIAWLQFSSDGQRLAALELSHGIQLWELRRLLGLGAPPGVSSADVFSLGHAFLLIPVGEE